MTAEELAARLQAALTPERLEVQDDSHLHAGHAGAREGRHFSVRIRSARFAGLFCRALAISSGVASKSCLVFGGGSAWRVA